MSVMSPPPGPGGAMPPRPPLSGAPGQPPTQGPPGGMPPPPGPPPQSPPPSAGQGPNAQSPFSGLLADLSPTMGPGWQSLDVCTRAYKVALRSPEFQKMPAVVAVLQSQLKTLTELVSNYTSGTSGVDSSGGMSGGTPSSSTTATNETPGADADSAPAAAEDPGDQ